MLLADAPLGPSWNIITDIQQLWSFPFMVNAFRAGTIVAVASAVMGWFMVLRRQTFAGHTLAVVGFPGAAGATLIGASSSSTSTTRDVRTSRLTRRNSLRASGRRSWRA